MDTDSGTAVGKKRKADKKKEKKDKKKLKKSADKKNKKDKKKKDKKKDRKPKKNKKDKKGKDKVPEQQHEDKAKKKAKEREELQTGHDRNRMEGKGKELATESTPEWFRLWVIEQQRESKQHNKLEAKRWHSICDILAQLATPPSGIGERLRELSNLIGTPQGQK